MCAPKSLTLISATPSQRPCPTYVCTYNLYVHVCVLRTISSLCGVDGLLSSRPFKKISSVSDRSAELRKAAERGRNVGKGVIAINYWVPEWETSERGADFITTLK